MNLDWQKSWFWAASELIHRKGLYLISLACCMTCWLTVTYVLNYCKTTPGSLGGKTHHKRIRSQDCYRDYTEQLVSRALI